MALSKHINRVHKQLEKLYHCHICDKSFGEKRTLKQHISKVHSDHQSFNEYMWNSNALEKIRTKKWKYIHFIYSCDCLFNSNYRIRQCSSFRWNVFSYCRKLGSYLYVRCFWICHSTLHKYITCMYPILVLVLYFGNCNVCISFDIFVS